jgi:hypothetical protein
MSVKSSKSVFGKKSLFTGKQVNWFIHLT